MSTLLNLLLLFTISLAPIQDPSPGPLPLTNTKDEAEQGQKKQKREEAKREEDTFAIETNLVVVNVTIRDGKHHFVPDLGLRNFKILEDKVEQKILSFDFEENPFAGAILLDASGSMETRLSLVRAACATFIDRLGEGDSYAIYSFGDSKVRLLQDFTEIRDIPDAVWDLKAKGMTTLYDAIVEAADALAERAERRRAILVVSDGADNQSRASLDQAIRRAVEAQLIVYAVDLSDSALNIQNSGAAALRALATRTGGRFFSTPGGNRLREAFAETIDELRHQYTLTYNSSHEGMAREIGQKRKDGRWRSIEVRIDRPGLDIRTRQGYWAHQP
jgi:Ca-activated chloride channel homolog